MRDRPPGPDPPVRSHERHLKDRQREHHLDGLPLRHIAEADRPAIHRAADGAAKRLNDTRHPFQDRALPAPVRAQQSDEITRVDVHRQALEDRNPVVTQRDVL